MGTRALSSDVSAWAGCSTTTTEPLPEEEKVRGPLPLFPAQGAAHGRQARTLEWRPMGERPAGPGCAWTARIHMRDSSSLAGDSRWTTADRDELLDPTGVRISYGSSRIPMERDIACKYIWVAEREQEARLECPPTSIVARAWLRRRQEFKILGWSYVFATTIRMALTVQSDSIY